MKVHTVFIDVGDELDIKFVGAEALRLHMPYDQVLEAALQAKLHELHQKRYRQGEAEAMLNQSSTLAQKRW